MAELFVTVLSVSVTTGALALLLLLLSPVTGRYAAKWRFWVWAVLAVRLLIPVSGFLPRNDLAPLPESAAPSESAPVYNAPAAAAYPRFEFELPERLSEPIPAPAPAPEEQKASPKSINVTPLDILAAVWIIGAAACFSVHIIGFMLYKRRVLGCGEVLTSGEAADIFSEELGSVSRRSKLTLVRSSAAQSPMIMGYFRPILVLPEALPDGGQLRFMIRHELIHYRRRDVWFKLLFTAAVSLHWFDPAIWLMRRQADVDMELSVDEGVVSGAGIEERKAYSEALFSAVSTGSSISGSLSTRFSGGKKIMKKRFSNILTKFTKKNGAALLAAVVVLAVVTGALFGCTAKKPPETPELTDEIIKELIDRDTEIMRYIGESSPEHAAESDETAFGAPYYRVTDERIDDYSEWRDLLESTYTGQLLENYLASPAMTDIGGKTYCDGKEAPYDGSSPDYQVISTSAQTNADGSGGEHSEAEIRIVPSGANSGYQGVYTLSCEPGGEWKIENKRAEDSPGDYISLAEDYLTYERIYLYDTLGFSAENGVEIDGETYYPVTESGFESWSGLESFLRGLFTDDMADELLSGGPYVEQNGLTYAPEIGGKGNDLSAVYTTSLQVGDRTILKIYRRVLSEEDTVAATVLELADGENGRRVSGASVVYIEYVGDGLPTDLPLDYSDGQWSLSATAYNADSMSEPPAPEWDPNTDPLGYAGELMDHLGQRLFRASEVLCHEAYSFGDGERSHEPTVITEDLGDGVTVDVPFYAMPSPFDTPEGCMEAIRSVYTDDAAKECEPYFEEDDYTKIVDGYLYFADSEPVRYMLNMPLKSAEVVSESEIIAKSFFVWQDRSRSEAEIVFKRENGEWKIDGIYDTELKRRVFTVYTTRYEDELIDGESSDRLLNTLYTETGADEVYAFAAEDFDQNGTYEAFGIVGDVETGATLYFVNDGGVTEVERGSYAVSGDQVHILDFGYAKLYTVEAVGGASATFSEIFGVDGGTWYEDGLSGLGSGIDQMWYDGVALYNGGDYDGTFDETGRPEGGRTYKRYYFAYNFGFTELGGITITPDQLMTYSGAKEILDGISAEGGELESILYRGEKIGIININYRIASPDGGGINRHKTLMITGSYVSEISTDDGLIAPAMTENASFPQSFPLGNAAPEAGNTGYTE